MASLTANITLEFDQQLHAALEEVVEFVVNLYPHLEDELDIIILRNLRNEHSVKPVHHRSKKDKSNLSDELETWLARNLKGGRIGLRTYRAIKNGRTQVFDWDKKEFGYRYGYFDDMSVAEFHNTLLTKSALEVDHIGNVTWKKLLEAFDV